MTIAATRPTRMHSRLLPDGQRLHLQDGPIDLIVAASGDGDAVAAAYAAAERRFAGVLDELCAELTDLRARVVTGSSTSPSRPAGFASPIARAMLEAVLPFAADIFITPMAAVAGSVADDILRTLLAAGGGRIVRAYVNNGGDIALHLAPGARFTTGLVDRPDRPALFATAGIGADDGIGGIATSGAPGRSFSLGIADAVTVLARTGAEADAAATVIANAVDLPGDSRIGRVPARDLAPDSDLGAIAVTRHVPRLDAADRAAALDRGVNIAEGLRARGLITAAALHLQGLTRLVGPAFVPREELRHG